MDTRTAQGKSFEPDDIGDRQGDERRDRAAEQEAVTMSHTPEPWTTRNGIEINNQLGKEILCSGSYERNCDDAARIVACVNGCAGLNPAAYRACVEALKVCFDWIVLGNHEEAPGWIEARDKAQQALARAEQP